MCFSIKNKNIKDDYQYNFHIKINEYINKLRFRFRNIINIINIINIMFECHKCNKLFQKKQGLDYHLNKTKIKCNIKGLKVIDGKNIFKCNKCDNTYTRLYYLNKHKELKHSNNESINKSSDMEELKLQNHILEQKMNDMMEIIKKSCIQNNITNNIDNSTINNIDNSTANTMNIYLNQFSKENIEYIDDETYLKCLRDLLFGVPNLIQLINFNPEHPENHNIVLPNKNKPQYKVFDGVNWNYRSETWILRNLIINSTDRIDTFLEKLKSENIDKFPKLKDTLDKKFSDVKKKLLEDENTIKEYETLVKLGKDTSGMTEKMNKIFSGKLDYLEESYIPTDNNSKLLITRIKSNVFTGIDQIKTYNTTKNIKYLLPPEKKLCMLECDY
jgi:uncharacterized C2H2 Zn-finger protein